MCLLQVITSTWSEQLPSQHFNMYFTSQWARNLDHDCLSYTVMDDITLFEQAPPFHHQNILYCFRSSDAWTNNIDNHTDVIARSNKTRFILITFKQLQLMNVTADHLLKWSAPIDLTESYAAYLHSKSSAKDDYPSFYNCTMGWFGPQCQYTFDSNASFSAIVKSNFENRSFSQDDLQDPGTTCYMHLACKYGGSEFACLDWREVCDGKVDCPDEGSDEKHCFELEMNECEENEYRCQNGQCVAHEFFRDGNMNPECLDRTDEAIRMEKNYMVYHDRCASDPSFRCEEHTCKILPRDPAPYSCGDGSCLHHRSCTNKRHLLTMKFDSYADRNGLCWVVMACLSHFIDTRMKTLHEKWCQNLTTTTSQNLIREHCPPLFEFPTDFTVMGHVRFFYTNNISIRSNMYVRPAYVCYKQELCPFLPTTVYLHTSKNESMTCQSWNVSLAFYSISSWSALVRLIHRYFWPCSSLVPRGDAEKNITSLFLCPNSNKYISKHRLVDGIFDCVEDEDESYNNSCDLSSKYRLKCPSDGRCLAPTLINNLNFDCPDHSDEESDVHSQRKHRISFQTLCNRFTNIAPIMINGREQSDETDCEYWDCDNAYTRNNGIWDCPNGQDERPSPASFTCLSSEHFCISPVTYNLSCLSIEKVNDGQVDCIGGTDEQHICQRSLPKLPGYRFLCSNDSNECINIQWVCDNESDCFLGEDEHFCQRRVRNLCGTTWKDNRSLSEELLCQLDDKNRAAVRYFGLPNFPDYPPSTSSNKHLPLEDSIYALSAAIQPMSHAAPSTWPSRWRCHRGLNIRVHDQFKCVCPPSYYGDLCQHQNQRVSLTLQIHTVAEIQVTFAFLVALVDSDGHVHSYDQLSYLAMRDCNVKFQIYLLYATRPKDPTKTYAVRIDAYERSSLVHRATWLFPTRFDFLPVHRMAFRLNIPFIPAKSACALKCIHGHCRHAENNRTVSVCQCDDGWWGDRCEKELKCDCGPQSRCLGLVGNRSICLCPMERFGPRCYLTRSVCASHPCQNDGQCVSGDFERRAIHAFTCLCKERYSGDRCEIVSTRVEISFHSSIRTPPSILIHFISIYNHTDPLRITALRKIPFNQVSAVAYTSKAFRLIFVQFDGKFYLAYHRAVQQRLSQVSTLIQDSHRCLSITDLFNSTIRGLNTLHRIKFYHLPCQKHSQLVCFYEPLYICLCNTDREADCFEFDHNVTSNCAGEKFCENGGQCFHDDPVCPQKVTCGCRPCSYGSRCQFSTDDAGLSLDVILGYHIQVNAPFSQQPSILFISIAIATVLVAMGSVDALLSICTFRVPVIRKTACGLYLLATSITSLLVITAFALKMSLMIVSQMGIVTQRSFLLGHCIIMDSLVRMLLNVGDWLRACVCVELAFTICKGIGFNSVKSKRTAKLVIGGVYLFVLITTLHEPLHRQLSEDLEEQRTWCVTDYSSTWTSINSAVVLLHFLAPFVINIVSAVLIIVMAARRRSAVQQNLTQAQHLRAQFHQHKKLLISPCILVVLTVPRLIISFASGCMSSSRQSSLFLASYFLSFVPPLLTIAVFILPSTTYKQQLLRSVRTRRQRLAHSTLHSNQQQHVMSMHTTKNN